MKFYTYDRDTNEYKQTLQAEADPEATKLKGEFVPLVPTYATLQAPPEFGENQIPVYENKQWVIKPDYRKNFKAVDENLNISEIKNIGQPDTGYLVDNALAKEIEQDRSRFKIVDGQILKKSDEEYKKEQAAKEHERINGLKLTKRIFALALQELGITYTQLKTLIETNEQAQLEWDLCVELEHSNPLLDIMAEEVGLSSEMLDYIFQKGNGEDVEMPVVKENAEDETVEE